MKRIVAGVLLFVLALGCLTGTPASAAETEPYIIVQPSSPEYPENAVAVYTCEAFGANLTFDWYMVYEGTAYRLADADGSQPWAAHTVNSGTNATASAGTCFFEGILPGLNGAELYCVVEDGHYSVRSMSAVICVGASAMPPQLRVVGSMEVYRDEPCDLYCGVEMDGSKTYAYTWYQSGTGRLQDIIAVDRGAQTTDTLHIDTSVPGLNYYTCLVTDSDGGSAYSAIIPVLVMERPPVPQILTQTLPEARVGESYYARLESSVEDVQFYEYYAPGQHDTLEKAGLTMTSGGEISGVPKKAGEYSVIICAGNVSGEVSMGYTLTVKESEEKEPVNSSSADVSGAEPTSSHSAAASGTEQASSDKEDLSGRKPELKPAGTGSESESARESQQESSPENSGMSGTDIKASVGEKQELPWWMLLLTAMGAAGAGVAAVLLAKKRK